MYVYIYLHIYVQFSLNVGPVLLLHDDFFLKMNKVLQTCYQNMYFTAECF